MGLRIILLLCCFMTTHLQAQEKRPNIVFVHGIFDTGLIFKKLEKELTEQGYRCFSPSLQPNDARYGVADLAKKLELMVNEKFGLKEPIIIVGFSMGCLISRYFLDRLHASHRTKAFFAISGPHHGTLMAYFYPGKGARDMRPSSLFLRDLDAAHPTSPSFPIYTYWTPLDLMILPASSSHWKPAQDQIVWALLHPFMPSDGKVRSSIIEKIECMESH